MFYGRSRHNIKNNATFENVDATAFLRISAIFAIIFILALNLNFATFKLLKLLVDGDIESNPGPTSSNFLKVVQGSFHQGDPKFGHQLGYNVYVTPYLHYAGLLLNVLRCGLHTT